MAPPDNVSRPKSKNASQSHELPTVAHPGAFRVALYTAVCAVAELSVKAMVAL